MTDRTLSPDAEFGSNDWAALTLGLSKDLFFRKRDQLVAEGFPKPDPILKLYLKRDVQAWIDRRRTISDDVVIQGGEIDFAAL